MTKQIKHTYFYSHAPEVVWDYLTKPELLVQWLMKNNFEPVVGHEFTFNTNPIPSLDFDGIFYCKVIEIVPLKKLIYSMRGGPGEGQVNVDSLVVWTMTAKENGTELLLEHTGFKEANLSIFNAMNAGWLQNMQKIDKLITDAKQDTARA